MKAFPKERLDQIKNDIDASLKEINGPAVAAFDADGTLWDTDLGENFFKYQIKNGLIPDLPDNPWEYYLNLHDNISATDSYLWLAQINAGFPIKQVREWAQAAVDQLDPLPIFSAQKELMAHLHNSGVATYIVTASIQWAVEPAARYFDIPQENVIGVRTRVDDGLVTKEQEGSITYREGKVAGLLERNGGQHPFFCAGNTKGDLPLLESATHLRLVLAASKEDNSNYQSEREMLNIADERSWYSHSFL